jgi:hypothetical protein
MDKYSAAIPGQAKDPVPLLGLDISFVIVYNINETTMFEKR